ncbi:hypothetical protein B4102_3417 [Heyndrickxia sporothermodurans]|uniref:Uncharacterized protein n=1 Tax=Heyndrickxia sporothermodurans TaxID=46224 RepID=A0A150KTM6_9BACI|nr:hypothetical protein B4102_3417 [Heyndrickxia sporothermodurans]
MNIKKMYKYHILLYNFFVNIETFLFAVRQYKYKIIEN